MIILLSLFVGALLLLAMFFALKEWEEKRGVDTDMTAFLKRKSPDAEMKFINLLKRFVAFVHGIVLLVRDGFLYGVKFLVGWVQKIVVVVAAHMIHVARGNDLIAEGKIPSSYFKHLRDHKNSLNNASKSSPERVE